LKRLMTIATNTANLRLPGGAALWEKVCQTAQTKRARRLDMGISQGTAPLPFNLPKIQKAQLVAVVEGERDATNLTRLGMPATWQHSGGAGNFKPDLARGISPGKDDVAILPDNDEPGRKHAAMVARLLHPVAHSVKIVEIPELPLKGDVSDFIAKVARSIRSDTLYVKAAQWSTEWDFPHLLPHENERYVRNLADEIEAAGGPNEFWNPAKSTGLPTPFVKLNRMLAGGMRAGEVYVIGGNQAVWKNIARSSVQPRSDARRLQRPDVLYGNEPPFGFQRICRVFRPMSIWPSFVKRNKLAQTPRKTDSG